VLHEVVQLIHGSGSRPDIVNQRLENASRVLRAEDGSYGVKAVDCAGMDDGTEGYGQGGWGYGFGSQSFKRSDNFNDGVARANKLDAGLALWAYDGRRAESASAGCGRLHVGDPVQKTSLVCYQSTRAGISPS
jgi:hypothetical protein